MEQADRAIAIQAVTELARGFFLRAAIGAVMFLAMEEVLSWYPALGQIWHQIAIGVTVLAALSFAQWLDHLMRRAALAKSP